MNIYLLNATINGKILSEVLCDQGKIKGLITLNQDSANQSSEYYNYTEFCNKRGIECIELKSYGIHDKSDKAKLQGLEIDLLIIASWQRLIPEWLINHCTIGVIGAHGSHEGIENGRGRSPQNWAILTGQKSFSLSIFWIEAGVDNGNIIDTVEFEYLPTDTILASYVKVNLYKAKMILKNLENGRIEQKQGKPQKKEGLFLPQRVREDGKIDWNRDSRDISNMVRALTKPYPGAYTTFNHENIFIWSALPIIVDDEIYSNYSCGCILSLLNDSFLVKCSSNLLLVDNYESNVKLQEYMVFESVNYVQQIKEIIDRHNKKYGTPISPLILDEVNE